MLLDMKKFRDESDRRILRPETGNKMYVKNKNRS